MGHEVFLGEEALIFALIPLSERRKVTVTANLSRSPIEEHIKEEGQ